MADSVGGGFDARIRMDRTEPQGAPLTGKQEKFARLVVEGLSQSDAYRQAYNAANMSDQAIWVEACRTAGIPKVSRMIDQLKADAADAAKVNRGFILAGLVRNATQSANAAASNRAYELLGKEIGMFKDAPEDSFANATDAELRAELASLLREAVKAPGGSIEDKARAALLSSTDSDKQH